MLELSKLSEKQQNSILKFVEEPLKNSYIILVADNENQVIVSVVASPNAMEHWTMQYINHVEIVFPESLRIRLKEALEYGLKKYK